MDDDSALASSAMDHTLNVWKVSGDADANRDPLVAEKKATNFIAMAVFKVYDEKGAKQLTFASAQDGNVYVFENKQTNIIYEAGSSFSQVVVLRGQRALIGGTADPRPGSLQVISYNPASP